MGNKANRGYANPREFKLPIPRYLVCDASIGRENVTIICTWLFLIVSYLEFIHLFDRFFRSALIDRTHCYPGFEI
ncbi:MAG: hypothetical protein KDC80_20115 [Saprospiraceae bacterium]|nr:hypothetical protein [Saprospiraceae bacterium]